MRRVEAPPSARRLSAYGLGAGESAVLASAGEYQDAEALLDDRRARRVARELEIPTVGTLGLVLRAKLRGDIPSARPVIERLRRAGLYLDPEVARRALGLVGE